MWRGRDCAEVDWLSHVGKTRGDFAGFDWNSNTSVRGKEKSFAPNSSEINLRDTSLMQYPNFPTTSQTEHRLSFWRYFSIFWRINSSYQLLKQLIYEDYMVTVCMENIKAMWVAQCAEGRISAARQRWINTCPKCTVETLNYRVTTICITLVSPTAIWYSFYI